MRVRRDQAGHIAVGERRLFNPVHRPFRDGGVPHSLADISIRRKYLRDEPSRHVASGLRETLRGM